MKVELSFNEIAEAIRKYAHAPNSDVVFTARPEGGQLLGLTAIVEDSRPQPAANSLVATAVSKNEKNE